MTPHTEHHETTRDLLLWATLGLVIAAGAGFWLWVEIWNELFERWREVRRAKGHWWERPIKKEERHEL